MKDDSNFLDQFAPYFSKINEELEKILDSDVSLIREVGRYSLLGGGKRLRSLFFILSCQLCNYNEKDIYTISAIFECLHAASLLHDDVLDNASIRRGRSSANKIWGNSTAVLVGDFLFSRSSRILVEQKHVEFLKILADTATRMTEGQMLEASGGIMAGAKKENIQSLKNFGLNVGIAFQIVDDIFDYTSTVEKSGKPIGNDLKEGKITLPLIYALAYVEKRERDRLEDLFKKGKASEKDYSRVISLVKDNGAIKKCHQDAISYANLAENQLDLFPDSPVKESLLQLNRFIVNRDC
ncbi:MAG: polyprenyl synthetase family protein [Deltaproteobacteria bacterium]|nr:polyprenyl synthetase family protein [Deltaproteobacteria bacterium]